MRIAPRQRPIPPEIACKSCGSGNLVRFGSYKGVQRYRCVSCGSTFMGKNTLPHMKMPIEVVADAVSMFYEGLSLNAIRRQLIQTYDIYPSGSNVYLWVVRFTKQAVKAGKGFTGKVGDTWVADETMLKIGGQKVWFWDCIDDRTRFLLSSHLTTGRFTRDAQILMERAARRANKTPKKVITDKLAAYIDGIERAFGAYTKHVQSKGFEVQPNTNLIERFHSTLKARSRVMRGMQNMETARLILDGWLIHYNFFRPHEALGNRTPGEVAKVGFPFANWREVVIGGK